MPAKMTNSEIWNTLAQLLRLGGTFGESKNEFWAPYVFNRFPDDYDGFDFSATIAKGVRGGARQATRLQ